MTSHLRPEEIIDIADGGRPEATAPHLLSCERCRRQLLDVRATRDAAAAADIPEPSPLFWDHFSIRVAEAIASSGQPRRWLSFDGWSWRRIAIPLSIATVLVVAAVVVRNGDRVAENAPVTERAGEPAALPDDPLLDLVADVSVDVDWDSVADAGLATHDGTVDTAVMQLTDAERVELHRLLEQELRRSGD
jgi:hypothetical protein